MNKIKDKLKALGPGLLFAGAAIGVSHLVQSTRAGADYGFSLLWALVIIHIVKYPFFQFGTRYANATGENLLQGYNRIHKGTLIGYFIINLASIFTIQAALTLVTAGIVMNILNIHINPAIVSIIITAICAVILLVGRYQLLDKVMKYIVLTLTITTIAALCIAIQKNVEPVSFLQKHHFEPTEVVFLIAFLGWMPAPLDVSIWQSLWSQEKQKDITTKSNLKSVLFDFNVGYFFTLLLGICFLSMGALVMYNSGTVFQNGALGFSKQLIEMYTQNIGGASFIFIAVAAFTTMFSTTLTALDASSRTMETTLNLLQDNPSKKTYLYWLIALAIGTILIISFFTDQMLTLIKVATVIGFLTTPFFAVLNYTLITSKHTPKTHQPSLGLKILSWIGIAFLTGFSIWYVSTLFM
ncbi:Nramp family divalent metal transporter [Wenyingzhuangia aestuarii]|uniref:Nramp family divalent metal transporter n=1 Tax=Wenyingzhuangia aestuarii TaxID=1647582 RepID=UPI00143A2A86|nr:Nramp family divalent metal transporter [Wenyingzhuangia aestuarii]NJB81867.1 Mn2+/Fe2+ NRAMP family transporter [Wenyingzhuangia aestuarii]